MGYLVERAQLIDKLFKSLHLALARVPGSLAVATIVTCAIFATATGIVGAVVTLMGLLAFPAMLKAGYNIKISAGAITAGGCLGILIPPSVLLIVYGATAGVSVVQLYAGAFFPGLHARGALHRLRHRAGEMEARADAAAAGERAARGAAGLRAIAAAVRRQRIGRPFAGLYRRAPAPWTWRNARCWPSWSSRCCRRCSSSPCWASPIAWRPRRKSKTDTAGLIEAGGAIAADASESEQSSGLIGAEEPPAEEAEEGSGQAGSPAAKRAGRSARAGGRARRSAPACAALVLDRARGRRRHDRADLLAVELGAARGIQDAAHLVLPAGDADPHGAGLDRVRALDADRGGGGWRVRRIPPCRGLPLHRSLARPGGQRANRARRSLPR